MNTCLNEKITTFIFLYLIPPCQPFASQMTIWNRDYLNNLYCHYILNNLYYLLHPWTYKDIFWNPESVFLMLYNPLLMPAAGICLKLLKPVALTIAFQVISFLVGLRISHLRLDKDFTSLRRLIKLFIKWLLAVFDGERPEAYLRQSYYRDRHIKELWFEELCFTRQKGSALKFHPYKLSIIVSLLSIESL